MPRNGLTTREKAGQLQDYDPTQAKVKISKADAGMGHFARIRDWPSFDNALDAKLAEIEKFVADWDATVGVRHAAGTEKNAGLRSTMSKAEAEKQSGIKQQQVSRWRKDFTNASAYRNRINGKFRRGDIGLDPADNHRAEGTGENEWHTPLKYIEAARSVMGEIDLDPATNKKAQKRIKAKKIFTAKENGLLKNWHGRVWLNPPYSRELIGPFVSKLCEELVIGRVTEAVLLTHNYTDTAWFHEAESLAKQLCFTRGRVKFVDEQNNECAPTQGQCFFYYGNAAQLFSQTFLEFGFIR